MGIARKMAYVTCLISITFYPFQFSWSKSHIFENTSYQPAFEFSLKGGHKRSLGRAGIVIPLQISDRGLWFTQLWGLWDSEAAKEWNIGLGYRHRCADWVIGTYGFFDRRLSVFKHYHSQLTVGAELLGAYLETRINAYVPTTAIIPSLVDKTHRASLVWANMLEKSLGGIDIEIGGTLTPGKVLQGFLTYYHFNGSSVKAIDGLRIRGQLQLTHYVAFTGEVSYDRLRKTSWFAGMQLNFHLGAPEKKLSEKMTQMVIRDIDVITDGYAHHKKRAYKNRQSIYTIQKLSKSFIDKGSAFLEIKAFIASPTIRNHIQSIVVYAPTDIRLKPRNLHHLSTMASQLISVPCHDVQGIAACKHLKDLSYMMHHSYWRITSIGKGYGISVQARGLGGGANHSKDGAALGPNMTYAASGGVAISQSSHVTVQHTTVRQEAPQPFKPQALGVRPDRNPQFVARQSATGADVLTELTRRFDNTSSLTMVVVTGMGGLGKTQLAVEYMEQHKDLYDGMFWVQANTSPIHYLSFIEALAIDLKETKPEVLVPTIHKSLMKLNYQKVLWVYDDVPNASVFHTELFHKELKSIWHQARTQIHVLVTSRYQDWGRMMPIEMALFDKKNTTAYIASFFKEGFIPFPQPSSGEVAQFNTLLGGLPLAIAQAVAYIHHKQDGTGLRAYIEAYQANYKQAAWLEYSIEALDDYDKTVWTTWDITRKNLSEEADSLLQMSCFLAHEPIAKLLFSPLGKTNVHRMAKELADYSLIKLSSDYQSFSLHVLLQKVLQLQQGKGCGALKRVCALAAEAKDSFDERKAHSWDRVKQWLPHLQALLEHVEDEVLSARLFDNYGIIANFFGAYTLAKHYYNEALVLHIRHYGEDHIELADTLHNLGAVEAALGQYEAAKGYYSQALALLTHHYGQGHLELAATLNNLGIVESELGHHEVAKNYYTQALALKTGHYGEDHIQLAMTLTNLGIVESELGHHEVAKSYYIQALALKTRHYGEGHIQLAMTLNNLGIVESNLGYYEAAKDYLEKALALKVRHYGEGHIQLAATLYNLGSVEKNLGHDEVAKDYYTQALALQTHHYGPEHIELAATLHKLGTVEAELGQYKSAKVYLEKALALLTRHYGEGHAQLTATLKNLEMLKSKINCKAA